MSAFTQTQEKLKNIRSSLKTLQPVATDKENLTGRPVKIVEKDAIKEVKIEIKDKNEHKRKKTTHTTDSKGIQAGENDNISIDDLISDAGPSENYWQILAEKRGDALAEALQENKELHEKIEKLEEENRICHQLLEETKSLVEVLKEMADQDDSGINLTAASSSSAFNETQDDNEKE